MEERPLVLLKDSASVIGTATFAPPPCPPRGTTWGWGLARGGTGRGSVFHADRLSAAAASWGCAHSHGT